jgi:hypothetical protein
LAPAPGSQVPSMAFATGMQARLPLGPLARGFLTTPQASLHAADWPVAPRPASTPGSRPTPGAALPGTLASPRAGLTPAGCRELALGYTINLPSISAPELLDAHSTEIAPSLRRDHLPASCRAGTAQHRAGAQNRGSSTPPGAGPPGRPAPPPRGPRLDGYSLMFAALLLFAGTLSEGSGAVLVPPAPCWRPCQHPPCTQSAG